MPVLNYDTEIRPALGMECCDEDVAFLKRLAGWVEGLAKKHVGSSIAQETITGELQRREDIGGCPDGGLWEISGDRVVYTEYGAMHGDVLQLDSGLVRSITEIREDAAAKFGQGSADFGSATVLTSGVDYALEKDTSGGISKSGRVLRINRSWPSKPGTVKITYVAGLTAAELNGEYSFVKLALLEEIQTRFSRFVSQRSAGGGPIKKETYVGDYAVEYATSGNGSSGNLSQLSPNVMAALQPIRRIAL